MLPFLLCFCIQALQSDQTQRFFNGGVGCPEALEGISSCTFSAIISVHYLLWNAYLLTLSRWKIMIPLKPCKDPTHIIIWQELENDSACSPTSYLLHVCKREQMSLKYSKNCIFWSVCVSGWNHYGELLCDYSSHNPHLPSPCVPVRSGRPQTHSVTAVKQPARQEAAYPWPPIPLGLHSKAQQKQETELKQFHMATVLQLLWLWHITLAHTLPLRYSKGRRSIRGRRGKRKRRRKWWGLEKAGWVTWQNLQWAI